MERTVFNDRKNPDESHLDEEIRYVVMGTEGYYAFKDTWRELPRQVGWLHYLGFILLGIDGIDRFDVDYFMQTRTAPRG